MKKIRWIKPIGSMRHAGMIEENDEDLCKTWVEKGHAEYVDDDAKTDAEEKAEDLERRRQPVQAGEEKAVHQSPVDRALKSKGAKGK